MAAITKIRMPDGTEIEINEWTPWAAFTSFEGAKASAVDMLLFSYTVGQRLPQAGPVIGGPRDASITDTNWLTRNETAADEGYIWYALTYETWALENNEPFENEPADLQATSPILRSTNLRIFQRDMLVGVRIGADIHKPQAQAPLEYYGQGMGAAAFGSGDALLISQGGATALELEYGTGGEVSPRNQRQWALPIYVPGQRVAKMFVNTPLGPMDGLDQDYRMRFTLDGLKRRAVA